jgi:hypothetical protein
MTFTTNSPLADLLELSRSGSGLFTPDQHRCLLQTIARIRQSSQCAAADTELQSPVAPFKDVAAAAAVPVTHANLKEYEAGVADTLCWGHSRDLLAAMRDGHVLPCPIFRAACCAHSPLPGLKRACLRPSCATRISTTCGLLFSCAALRSAPLPQPTICPPPPSPLLPPPSLAAGACHRRVRVEAPHRASWRQARRCSSTPTPCPHCAVTCGRLQVA